MRREGVVRPQEQKKRSPADEETNQEILRPDRLLAFSDGVFAIAITLLVLDIHAPSAQELTRNGHHLAEALGHQWPSYLSFLLSFLIVGVVWGNHHTMFSYIQRVNHLLVVLNLLLLLSVVVLPFSATVLADSLALPEQQTAVLLYSGILTVGGVFYNLVWWYASTNHLFLDTHLPTHVVRQLTRRYLLGPLLYGLAFSCSWVWNGTVGLGMCGLLALIYLLPTVADRVKPRGQKVK